MRSHAVTLEPRAQVPAAIRARYDERTGLHRRFFRSGIVVLLTAGAVWGAVLLLRISTAESFTAISIHDVNAHGHAQIFGWVGLFVMGFAYQMFVHRNESTDRGRRIVTASLIMMIAGIVLRVIGEPLHEFPALRIVAIIGASVEIVAIGVFAALVLKALRVPERVIPAERPYVTAAVGLFFVQAVYECALLVATTGDRTPKQLLDVISVWQAPLRDLQIHGFALLMILGVGLWLFPRTFGLGRPGRRWVSIGWVAIVGAVLSEAVGLVLMRTTGAHEWAALLFAGIVVLAVTSIGLTWRWLPGVGSSRKDRSVKFIRAACAWLTISMSMLVLAPVYVFVVLPGAGMLSDSGLRAVEIGFSHAYYGAVRHAITVGFISLMIMGVSARVVPMLGGMATKTMTPMWGAFILVNAGCTMRVALQTMTDFHQPAFAMIGMSGVLEVTGFTLWGLHLWRVMGGRRVLPVSGEIELSSSPLPAVSRKAGSTAGGALQMSWRPCNGRNPCVERESRRVAMPLRSRRRPE